jgi:glycosyltransferase involved in cell wall biosynthesis
MNIWWINHFANPPTQAGGTRHYSLARALQKRGHRAMVVASNVDYLSRAERGLKKGENAASEDFNGVSFLWLRSSKYSRNPFSRIGNMLTFAWRVWRADWRSQLAPDVLIGSTPQPFAALAAMYLARRLKVPFVLEVRDLWPQSLIDLGGYKAGHPFIWLLGRIERKLCRNARAVITLLPNSRAHLVDKGALERSIYWVPNGIDAEYMEDPVRPDGEGPFTLMYAGAHGVANGLDTLIDAAALLEKAGDRSRFRIILVGDGTEKPRLQNRVLQEGIKNVEFHKPVPKCEVRDKLQEADAFVLPLKPGGVFAHGISPNKLFEYMAMARPVIFATGSSSDPISKSGAGVSVAAGDPAALAGAARSLSEMGPDQRWAMGQRGRQYVLEHHEFNQLAERVEEALRFAGADAQ